jgi:hypothetical protein
MLFLKSYSNRALIFWSGFLVLSSSISHTHGVRKKNPRFPCYLVGKAFGFEKHWVIPNEDRTITHAQSILISDVFLIVTEQPYL